MNPFAVFGHFQNVQVSDFMNNIGMSIQIYRRDVIGHLNENGDGHCLRIHLEWPGFLLCWKNIGRIPFPK